MQTHSPACYGMVHPTPSESAGPPRPAALPASIDARHCARCPPESVPFPLPERHPSPVFRLPPALLYSPIQSLSSGELLRRSPPIRLRLRLLIIRNPPRLRLRPG